MRLLPPSSLPLHHPCLLCLQPVMTAVSLLSCHCSCGCAYQAPHKASMTRIVWIIVGTSASASASTVCAQACKARSLLAYPTPVHLSSCCTRAFPGTRFLPPSSLPFSRTQARGETRDPSPDIMREGCPRGFANYFSCLHDLSFSTPFLVSGCMESSSARLPAASRVALD